MKHKHHIIPKHMGGTDDPSNLIELSVEEHANAHLKLYEQYGKDEDLLAYKCLKGYLSKVEIIEERIKLGGKTQGIRNANSGHMAKIQKLSNPSAAGKKGGTTTIARGKGSFGNPEERLKSASKGGKTQGKRNAESGHLKRIAQLPNKRSKGKIWITNGTLNMMIMPSDVIPEGYRTGKTQIK
jgi:hypothetical protein